MLECKFKLRFLTYFLLPFFKCYDSSVFWTLGRKAGECYWLVSQSPWLWLLVIRNRCQYTDAKSAVPGTIRCNRSKWSVFCHLFIFFYVIPMCIAALVLICNNVALSYLERVTLLQLLLRSPKCTESLNNRKKSELVWNNGTSDFYVASHLFFCWFFLLVF